MQLPVPYIKQQTHWSCAIACLEMTAQFHGCTGCSQLAMYGKLKRPVPGQKGQWCVYNSDLMQEAMGLGLEVQDLRVNYTNVGDMMQTIQSHIENGLPMIASQRTAMNSPFGHSRLIVGWEQPEAGETEPFVIFHDPSAFTSPGVAPGGPYRKWRAGIFGRMWKPNGATVAGGVAIVVRKRLNVV